MSMKFKNNWGASGVNLDPQRTDLFRFRIHLPDFLGGQNAWNNHVEFAVERFPFPERAQQTFDMKYLNQINHCLGADAPTAPVEIPVRYSFSQMTANLLYRWHSLISNPMTGGVVRTSQIKSMGEFIWLVPKKITSSQDAEAAALSTREDPNALQEGFRYILEGCFPINLKPTDANMNEGNQYVTLTFRLSIDRFYPASLESAATKFD